MATKPSTHPCQVQNEYVPSSPKRSDVFSCRSSRFQARHSTAPVPIYITMDPNSPAFIVYHDHSYFIRHESTNNSLSTPTDTTHRRKSAIVHPKPSPSTASQLQQQQQKPTTTLPTVDTLNRLLLEHRSHLQSTLPSTSSTTGIDLAAILRALLAKQGHQLSPMKSNLDDRSEDASSLPSSIPSAVSSQLQSESSATSAS